MVMAKRFGQMDQSMKGIILAVKNKEMDFFYELMGQNILAILKRTKSMEREFTNGEMDVNTKAIGVETK